MAQLNSAFSNNPVKKRRAKRDLRAQRMFFFITVLPVLLILIITGALFFRAFPILNEYPLKDLLLGEIWKPNNGQFGFLPFILGTVWVTVVGLLLSVPACLLISIYLAEYAHERTRSLAKPILDLLAAIPPVVYGVWGLLAIVPFVDDILAPLADRWLATVPIFSVTQPTGFGILAGGIVLA
jgi:phosphate transport system permease protein